MRGSRINAKLLVDVTAKGVVRDHSLHRVLNDALRMLGANFLDRADLLTADVAGNAHVGLLVILVASKHHVFSIDDHDIITRIDVRGEDGLGFSTKEVGGMHSHIAKDLIFGVDDIPLAGDVLGFCGDSSFVHVLSGNENAGALIYLNTPAEGERETRGVLITVKLKLPSF